MKGMNFNREVWGEVKETKLGRGDAIFTKHSNQEAEAHASFSCIIVRRSKAETYRKDKRIKHFKESGERTNDRHSIRVTTGNETLTALVTTSKETGKWGFLSFLLLCEGGDCPAVLETSHRSTEDSLRSGFHSAKHTCHLLPQNWDVIRVRWPGHTDSYHHETLTGHFAHKSK